MSWLRVRCHVGMFHVQKCVAARKPGPGNLTEIRPCVFFFSTFWTAGSDGAGPIGAAMADFIRGAANFSFGTSTSSSAAAASSSSSSAAAPAAMVR